MTEKWKTLQLQSFKYAVMPLTPQDYKVWVFMKKAGIKSFNVKYDEGDGKYNIISIELDSIKYSSK